MEIDGSLSIEPEIGRRPKGRSELERHLRGHRRSPIDEPVHHFDVTSDMAGKFSLSHVEGLKKLLAKDLSSGSRHSASGHVQIL